MSLYGGVDLHGNNGYYAVVDQDNNRVYGKRLPNDLDVVLRELEPYRKELTGIAVESTYNWYWLVDGLMETQHAVRLANPAAMKQYEGIKDTNDKTDAFFIADQLRLGILKEGYIYPKEERAVRDVLRRRMLFVRQRTAQALSLQGLYSRQTGEEIGMNRIRTLTPSEVEKTFESEPVRLMGTASLETIRFLKERVEELEQYALDHCRLKPEYEKLLGVPGIGKTLALTIMLETGEIRRFAEAGNYTSYCRCVKAERESNARKKGENNRKNGNKYLCWAYIEAANFMIRYSEEAQRWYQRKLVRCGGKKVVAIKSLAAKISKACYYILRDQADFDVKRMFG
jgi:transposase